MSATALDRSDLELAHARFVLRLVPPEALPDLACRALEAGFDSPSLRLLAGESSPTWEPAAALARATFAELGLATLSEAEAKLRVAQHWAKLLLAGDLTPYEGARHIADECCSARLDPDAPWDAFYSLASEHEDYLGERASDPERYDALVSRCEEEIHEAARRLVAGEAPAARGPAHDARAYPRGLPSDELVCLPFLDTDVSRDLPIADAELAARGYPAWLVRGLRGVARIGLWYQAVAWEWGALGVYDVCLGYGVLFVVAAPFAAMLSGLLLGTIVWGTLPLGAGLLLLAAGALGLVLRRSALERRPG